MEKTHRRRALSLLGDSSVQECISRPAVAGAHGGAMEELVTKAKWTGSKTPTAVWPEDEDLHERGKQLILQMCDGVTPVSVHGARVLLHIVLRSSPQHEEAASRLVECHSRTIRRILTQLGFAYRSVSSLAVKLPPAEEVALLQSVLQRRLAEDVLLHCDLCVEYGRDPYQALYGFFAGVGEKGTSTSQVHRQPLPSGSNCVTCCGRTWLPRDNYNPCRW